MRRLLPALLLAGSTLAAPALAGEDASALYAEHCAACHGPDRLGAMGPALLPSNLGRLKPAQAEKVIAEGRPASQMKGFAEVLSPEQVKALAGFIYTPPAETPRWEMADIAASHTVSQAALPEKPPFASDPMNLFTVVEAGDHHVTILDGDTLTPRHRFATRFALHGGAKYSPDGRFVFLMSRDGWVSKVDMWTGTQVAEIRAGINARNIAVSHDGKLVMVGNVLPHSLVALDAADLSPLEVIRVADDKDPAKTSAVSAVYTAPPRSSFVVALKDLKQVWEIPYGEKREPVYRGFVHNYEKGMAEGLAEQGRFPVRRIAVDTWLDDFFFDPAYRHLIGAGREGDGAHVINLLTGRDIATIPLPGMPHLGSGIAFTWQGRPVLATPHLKEAAVSVIDMTTWREIKRIATCGPGFFMRGHENSPYAWVDCSLSPTAKDTLQVIDTRTLEVVASPRPAPGRATGHVEFSRDGRTLLLSVMERDGALIALDANDFSEIKRLPMSHPVGKYNVFNKVNYSSGTSH